MICLDRRRARGAGRSPGRRGRRVARSPGRELQRLRGVRGVAAGAGADARSTSMSPASTTPSTGRLLRRLEALDARDRAGAELAVDDVASRRAEEVLEDLDVVAAHARRERDAVAEALRRWPWRPCRVAAAAYGLAEPPAARGAAPRGSRARPTPEAAGWRRAGSAATARLGARAEVAVGRDLEADLGQQAAGACGRPRPGSPAAACGRPRCADARPVGVGLREAGTSRAPRRRATGMRQQANGGRRNVGDDGGTPLFRAPTGLAVGLGLKELRYAASWRRFAPGRLSRPWVPRSPPWARGFGWSKRRRRHCAARTRADAVSRNPRARSGASRSASPVASAASAIASATSARAAATRERRTRRARARRRRAGRGRRRSAGSRPRSGWRRSPRPAPAPTIGRPERAAGRAPAAGAVAARASIPGHRAQPAVSVAPPTSSGTAASTASKRPGGRRARRRSARPRRGRR